jgi:hypothetical protein
MNKKFWGLIYLFTYVKYMHVSNHFLFLFNSSLGLMISHQSCSVSNRSVLITGFLSV